MPVSIRKRGSSANGYGWACEKGPASPQGAGPWCCLEGGLRRAGEGSRCRQEPMDLGPATCLGAVRHGELPVDVGEVELDRLLGHPEHLCELRVRVALRDELEDLELAAGEPG